MSVGMNLKLIFFVFVTAFIAGWVVLSTWVGYRVHEACIIATKHYSGRCSEALEKIVDEGSFGYRSRNDAIWALGQLGDRRSLRTLERYYAGSVPSRENYDQTLSQYELRKAIDLITAEQNLTALWWRVDKN